MNNSITAEAAHKLLCDESTKSILVDVRSANEYNSTHAQHAVHVPLENISSPESMELLKNKKVFCICQSGTRGKKAVEALARLGLEEIANVEGGTSAWTAANLPVVKGEASVSMERQVRIAAGILVVIGALAAILTSPYFIAVPLFVGAGLVFSGVTNTCGMALVLARCPWNK